MNGFIDPKSYEHALKVAMGPYPTVALVPHPMMNLPEAKYAAEALFGRWGQFHFNRQEAKRIKAYYADCCDVLLECQR